MTKQRFKSIGLTLTAVLVFPANPLWAGTCSACRQALSSSGDDNLINGLRISVLILVTTVMTAVTVIALKIRRAHRKQARSLHHLEPGVG